MRRREFLGVIGAAAAAWPLCARAQQAERIRRIGVLQPASVGDPESEARLAAFVQGMRELGWTEGRNLRIDTRWTGGNAETIRRHAAELIALAPDVILAIGGTVAGPVLQQTRTVPIVFTQTPDPVGTGFVASLARPGGNATGFINFEYATSAKWPELLKQVAPSLTRVAILRDATIPPGAAQFSVLQAAAPLLGLKLSPVDVQYAGEIERAVTTFAGHPNGGLIVTSSGLARLHRELIVRLAARHRLPAVYPYRFFVNAGGLISYGPDSIDPQHRAAGYVDRILKGEKPADLPVQTPTKYELVINLKTAKALGLTVPPTLLARADEVIE